jgi:hypothetical protein
MMSTEGSMDYATGFQAGYAMGLRDSKELAMTISTEQFEILAKSIEAKIREEFVEQLGFLQLQITELQNDVADLQEEGNQVIRLPDQTNSAA